MKKVSFTCALEKPPPGRRPPRRRALPQHTPRKRTHGGSITSPELPHPPARRRAPTPNCTHTAWALRLTIAKRQCGRRALRGGQSGRGSRSPHTQQSENAAAAAAKNTNGGAGRRQAKKKGGAQGVIRCSGAGARGVAWRWRLLREDAIKGGERGRVWEIVCGVLCVEGCVLTGGWSGRQRLIIRRSTRQRRQALSSAWAQACAPGGWPRLQRLRRGARACCAHVCMPHVALWLAGAGEGSHQSALGRGSEEE